MENRIKGASALEMLFIAFVILKVIGIPPLNGWSWFGLIAVPIYAKLVIGLCRRVWEKMGLRGIFYATLESKLYDIRLKKAVKDYQKLNLKERDARLIRIKELIRQANEQVYADNEERAEKSK